MHKFTKRTEVDRPPEVVWLFLTELEKIRLLSNLETIKQEPEGPVEKGTRWHQTMRLLGKTLETTDEAIEVEEGHLLTVRSIESPIPYLFTYTLEPRPGGTHVVLEVEIHETGGFFGRLSEPVVAKFMEHEFRGQLERLKAFAEVEPV